MSWRLRPKPRAWGIRTSSYTVVFDACVLYPAPLRDLLIELAVSGLFRAKWSDAIHDEWTRNLLADRTDLSVASLARTRELMNLAVMDCLVADYQAIAATLSLPDSDDNHVLAVAIKAGASAIITFNLKDFPASELSKYGIEAQHPDTFIQHQFGLDASLVVIAAQRCRARLKHPSRTVSEYLDTLERQSLPLSVAELRPFSAVL